MKYIVEIFYKNDVFDASSQNLKNDIIDLGIKKNMNVKISQLYKIEGEIKQEDIKIICEDVLIDPIVQDYTYHLLHPEGCDYHYSVEVWLKKGVTDSTGESTCKAIKDANIGGVIKVETGKKYSIFGKIKKSEVKKIISCLLVNPLIQEYRIILHNLN